VWCAAVAADYRVPLGQRQHTQTSNTQPRGLGWRIHCGVKVTELSTNKQHTLSFYL
jgi:hypothetical protein